VGVIRSYRADGLSVVFNFFCQKPHARSAAFSALDYRIFNVCTHSCLYVGVDFINQLEVLMAVITLKGRKVHKQVEPETGLTILDLAMKHEVDWAFSCTRGSCARCRCLVTEGREFLKLPTDEELDRLEPEEIEEGFRLGCQAAFKIAGTVTVVHKPYF
jgi:2Fe-2S ferredoxin